MLCLKNPKQTEFKALGLACSAKQFTLMCMELARYVTRQHICEKEGDCLWDSHLQLIKMTLTRGK